MKRQEQSSIDGGKITELSEQYFINSCLKLFPHQNYKFKIMEIPTKSIVPLCKYVYESRLIFAQQLVALYEATSIGLFAPCVFTNSLGHKSVIAPPVIEQREGINVLCDGMHRIYSVVNSSRRYIIALVAYDYGLPLPGKLNCWRNVRIMPEQLPVESNFIDFDVNGLTGYTFFFNSEYYTDLLSTEEM